MRRISDRPACDRHCDATDIHRHDFYAEHLCDPFCGQGLSGWRVGNDAATVHHQHAVGKARRQGKVVDHGEYRSAVARRLAQKVHHHELMARIERLLAETPAGDLSKLWSAQELEDSGTGPGRAASLAIILLALTLTAFWM